MSGKHVPEIQEIRHQSTRREQLTLYASKILTALEEVNVDMNPASGRFCYKMRNLKCRNDEL